MSDNPAEQMTSEAQHSKLWKLPIIDFLRSSPIYNKSAPKLIESILACRDKMLYDDQEDEDDAKPTHSRSSPRDYATDDDQLSSYDFLVKFCNLGYAHSKWVPSARVAMREMPLRRQAEAFAKEWEKARVSHSAEDFIARNSIPERVLCTISLEGRAYCLVKWRDLAYTSSTWEKEQDLPAALVRQNTVSVLDHLSRNGQYKEHFEPASLRLEDGGSAVFGPSVRLAPLQISGVSHLLRNYYLGRNNVISDVLSSYRSIQTLALIRAAQPNMPSLLVCPASRMESWQEESAKFEDLRTCFFQSTKQDLDFCRKYDWKLHQKDGSILSGPAPSFDLLVVPYEVFHCNFAMFSAISWSIVAVDEAHRLKSQSGLRTSVAKLLTSPRATSRAPHAVFISEGIPHLPPGDIFTPVLSLVCPDVFNAPLADELFRASSQSSSVDASAHVNVLLQPFLLHRTREECENDVFLRPLVNDTVTLNLTPHQKKWYRTILQDYFGEYLTQNATKLGFDESDGVFYVDSQPTTSKQTEKMCKERLLASCIHPLLLPGGQKYADFVANHPEETIASFDGSLSDMDLASASPEWVQSEEIYLIKSSSKLFYLDRALQDLQQLHSDSSVALRVVVLSSYSNLLHILQAYAQLRGFASVIVDDSLEVSEKASRIHDFERSKSSSQIRLLLSQKAHHFAPVCLKDVSSVYLFDTNQDPEVEMRALEALRFSQHTTSPLTVVRLINRHTIEEGILERIEKKSAASVADMDGQGDAKSFSAASTFNDASESPQPSFWDIKSYINDSIQASSTHQQRNPFAVARASSSADMAVSASSQTASSMPTSAASMMQASTPLFANIFANKGLPTVPQVLAPAAGTSTAFSQASSIESMLRHGAYATFADDQTPNPPAQATHSSFPGTSSASQPADGASFWRNMAP